MTPANPNGLSYDSQMDTQNDSNNERTAQNQPETAKREAERIKNRYDRLETDAVNWKTHWQEIYENIVPRKEDVVATRMPGDRRNSDLYDTTAILANEMLASALHGMLTNPETRFFELTFGDPKLDENQAVKDWCQDCGDRMFRVLNNTNFQTEIYEVYVDLGAIGTACMYMGEHDEDIVHFSARAMKEVRIDENARGLIDVVLRCFKFRPFQVIGQFGKKNCPGDIIRAADKNSQDQLDILHEVEPLQPENDEHADLLAAGFRYKSTYILKEMGFVLHRGGFREFPYAVPRWTKTTGEIYGRGPGMSMLPDILMVNAMMLTVIQGAQKMVDPPLMVEDDGVIGAVRLTPGGLTIVRPGSTRIAPLITNGNIDFGQKCVEDVRSRIRAGFYVDQFQMQEGPQKTAEEVRQSTEDKLRLMGPVLGRQHYELLRPLIRRLFDIMSRRGLLPDAPGIIQGKKMDVRYSSSIARAQRMTDAQNIARALQIMQPIWEQKPQSSDAVDFDAIVRELWGIFGNKHSLLFTAQKLAENRAAVSKLQQQQMKMQQEQHQAQVAKNTAPMISAMGQAQQNQPQGPGQPQGQPQNGAT